jgi:galactokinase
VTTTIPLGTGLSPSAALEVAVALALGGDAYDRKDLAQLCREAEHRASGVPCGIMDQLASLLGVEGHALLIDCTTLEVEPVALPDDVDIVVVDSHEPRRLDTSGYAARRDEVTAAAELIGPLAKASLDAGSRRDLAAVLVDVLHRLDALWDEPMPYMLWFHQRPFDGGAWPQAHIHAEIAVPLRAPGVQRYVAAGELGSGQYVNPVIPEAAARELREVTW